MSRSTIETRRAGVACRLSVDTATDRGDGAALAVLFAAPLPAWPGALARSGSPVVRSVPLTGSKRGRTVSLSMAMSPGHWALGALILDAPQQARAAIDEALGRLRVLLDDGLSSTDHHGWPSADDDPVIVPSDDHPLGRLHRGPAHAVLHDLVTGRQLARHAAFDRAAEFRSPLDVVTRIRNDRHDRTRRGGRVEPQGDPAIRSACFNRIVVAGPRDIELPFDVAIRGSKPDGRQANTTSRFVGKLQATASLSLGATTAGRGRTRR